MAKSRADAVMNTIESEKVTIRSGVSLWASKIARGGFLWIIIAMLLGLFIVLSVWIATNNDLLSLYGQTGLWSFLQAFPYIPLFLILPVLGAFLLLIRAYDVSYKKPLLGIILGVILVSVLVAGLLGRNKSVAHIVTDSGRMFGVGQMAGKNFLIGTVQAYKDNELKIKQDNGSVVSIRLTDETHFPFGTPSIGDAVRVVGDTEESGIFEAVGVRVFEEDSMYGTGKGVGRMDGSGQGKGNRNGFLQPSQSPQPMPPTFQVTPDTTHTITPLNGQQYRRGRMQNPQTNQ